MRCCSEPTLRRGNISLACALSDSPSTAKISPNRTSLLVAMRLDPTVARREIGLNESNVHPPRGKANLATTAGLHVQLLIPRAAGIRW